VPQGIAHANVSDIAWERADDQVILDVPDPLTIYLFYGARQ
jgi:hypothetical protein